MSDYENTTPPSIAYMKQFFWQHLEALFKELGRECGLREKADHEAMVAYVEQQSTLLRSLISIEHGKLAALVEAQARQIEAQGRQIKALETRLAKPKRDAAAPVEYRPTMRLS
jgi:hypothetical protein